MTRFPHLFWTKRSFTTPQGPGSWFDQLNSLTPLPSGKPPVPAPSFSNPTPPPRIGHPMGGGGRGTGVAATAAAAPPHPALGGQAGGWASPSMGGASVDSFHARSGVGPAAGPTWAATNFGDTSKMTDDQKTQLANMTMGRGFHSDWSSPTMKSYNVAPGESTGTFDIMRSRDLQGGLAPDPRTGKLVNAGTSTTGQLTQHDSARGLVNPQLGETKIYHTINTPYGSGTTADVGSKAHDEWRAQSGTTQPKLNPGGKSLTDNGVTTTSQGAGAFQAQLTPMQQQQAQKFVQDQKMNNPSVFGSQLPPGYAGMSDKSKQEYWNNAPKAPYNDGLPEHPALKMPQQVQNGVANITQSNLPAVAPQAPGSGLAKPPANTAANNPVPPKPSAAPPPPLPPAPAAAAAPSGSAPNMAGAAPTAPATPAAAAAPKPVAPPASASAPTPATPKVAAVRPPKIKPTHPALQFVAGANSSNRTPQTGAVGALTPASQPASVQPPQVPAVKLPHKSAGTIPRAPNDWRNLPSKSPFTPNPHPVAPPAGTPSPAWMGRSVPSEAANMGVGNPNLLRGINATPTTPPVGVSALPSLHPVV